MKRSRVTLAGLLGLVLLRVVLDVGALAATPRAFLDWEERYNAAVAWSVVELGLWDQLLVLQYKEFCGGCTAVALAAAPAFALAGQGFWVWKGLAVGLTALTVLLGFVALDRWVGRGAAWMGAALLVLPPPGLAALQHMLWGNHVEGGVLALGLLVLAAPGRGGGPGRLLAMGLLAGLALWFTRSTAYALVVLLPLLVWRHRSRSWPMLLGLLPGLLCMALPAAGGDRGRYPGFLDGPGSLTEVLGRLSTLVQPWELAARAFHAPPDWPLALVWLLAAGSGAALLLLRGSAGRVLVAAALAFLVGVALVPVSMPPAGPGFPLIGARYHAPWMLLLVLIVAAGWGPWLEGRGARRALAGTLLLGLCVVDRPGPLAMPGTLEVPGAVEGARFEVLASARLPARRLDRPDASLQRVRGMQLGYALAEGRLEPTEALGLAAGSPEALRGLGQGVVQPHWIRTQHRTFDAWVSLAPGGPNIVQGALLELLAQDALALQLLAVDPRSRPTPDSLYLAHRQLLCEDRLPCAAEQAAVGTLVRACGGLAPRREPRRVGDCVRVGLAAGPKGSAGLTGGAGQVLLWAGWSEAQRAEAGLGALLDFAPPEPPPLAVPQVHEGTGPPPWAAYGPVTRPWPPL